MSTQELAIADGLFLMEEWGEAVEYQGTAHGITAPWKAIRAVVRHGDPGNPLRIGAESARGPEPVVMRVSRDPLLGMEEVHVRRDLVKLNPGAAKERIVTVKAILEPDDPGLWCLYAT